MLLRLFCLENQIENEFFWGTILKITINPAYDIFCHSFTNYYQSAFQCFSETNLFQWAIF
jgi:hypothetical protein